MYCVRCDEFYVLDKNAKCQHTSIYLQHSDPHCADNAEKTMCVIPQQGYINITGSVLSCVEGCFYCLSETVCLLCDSGWEMN